MVQPNLNKGVYFSSETSCVLGIPHTECYQTKQGSNESTTLMEL